jgi:hypothetical protein
METIVVSVVAGVIAVAGLAAAAIARESYAGAAAEAIARESYAAGRLKGISEATSGLIRAAGACYEEKGQPFPEGVTKSIESVHAAVTKASGNQEKCYAYSIRLWEIGNAVGRATFDAGYEAGQRITDPRDGEVRVDLALMELLSVRWLAHLGFEHNIRCKNASFPFQDEKDAQEATNAILRLEYHIPRERDDPSDPYALAFNRQTMIRERWPSDTAG